MFCKQLIWITLINWKLYSIILHIIVIFFINRLSIVIFYLAHKLNKKLLIIWEKLFIFNYFQISKLLHEENDRLPRPPIENLSRKHLTIHNTSLKEISPYSDIYGSYSHFQNTLENVFKEVDGIKGKPISYLGI